ncbi:MAG: maleylpyruvate isomerase N-terminal domain-containing protein [Vicinamibacterales bacterium]
MALPPIDTAPLFAPMHDELMALLRSLDDADWGRPTVAGAWRVRDVAAHLLDTALRRVSAQRDGHAPPPPRPITSNADLVALIHALNASGVAFAARLSPRVLIALIDQAGAALTELVVGLPPRGQAIYPVSWAGESESEHWMDIGREYTERWHHQQQLRDAVGRPLLLDARWLVPLLDISVRALPYAYRDVNATAGTHLRLRVDDSADTTWMLTRTTDGWDIGTDHGRDAAHAEVSMTGDTAWRLFYNALPPDALRERVHVAGDDALAAPLLGTRSIVI